LPERSLASAPPDTGLNAPPVSGSTLPADLAATPGPIGTLPGGAPIGGLSGVPGLLNPAMDAVLNPEALGRGKTGGNTLPADFTGTNPPSMSGLPTGSESLPGSGAGTPIGSSTPNGIGLPLECSPPNPSELAGPLGSPLTGPGGMPMMPGMPGSGAPGSQTPAERSDASGLLGGQKEPWVGSEPPGAVGEPGSPTGTVAGGSELNGAGELAPLTEPGLPAEGVPLTGPGGMPMMPGMPGSGAPGSQNSAERSDASGLLGGEKEPWLAHSPDATIGEVGSPTGALAGGPGLAEPAPVAVGSDGLPLSESPLAQEGVGPGGMPMMPGMPGSGAPGSQSPAERSDASGLLGGESEPWTETRDPVTGEAGAAQGAASGGPGLTGVVPLLGAPGSPGAPAAESASGESESAALLEADAEAFGGDTEQADQGSHVMPPAIVPVARPGVEDRSAWEISGAAASALLGLTATGRAVEEDEHDIAARIVSTEHDAWIDDEQVAPALGSAASMEEGSGLASWRRAKSAGTAAEPEMREARSGRFPPGYVPPAPPEEEVKAEAAEEEDEDEPSTGSAKLLTQDASTWGGHAPDWGELE
jgi:hypothetical protein